MMNAPAIQTMTENLTLPFAQGASTLVIPLNARGNALQAPVSPYDFSDYQARYGPLPNPGYVLMIKKDIAVQTQVTVDYVNKSSGTKGNVTLTVPAETLAGASFAAWLQADGTSANSVLADPDIQLSTLRMSPGAVDGEAANWWSLIALLGNIAKLLWVISGEKDIIRRQMEIVESQRYLPQATKRSLDLLGLDLGIPRMPSRPYSFDENTIALYHLNDQISDNQPSGNPLFGIPLFGTRSFGSPVAPIRDSMADYGLPGHPGTGTGLAPAPGRFDGALAFRQPNAGISISDNTHAFDLPARQSFTLECFVKPDAGTPDGEVLARLGGGAGWSLSIGNFNRGITNNVRLLLSDGTTQVALFADQQISTSVFTHVAGVIDRQANNSLLYVDGKVVATQPITRLGALTNTNVVRIGSGSTSGTAYRGVIDEVRFSRTAHTTFHPVLGEADDAYRQRLMLFARWTLPTLPNLTDMINKSVGPIKRIRGPDPIVLEDTNTVSVGATLPLIVKPSNAIRIIRLFAVGTQLAADSSLLRVGDTVQLGIEPVPGQQQTLSWSMTNDENGQANFTTATNGSTVSLVATLPGLLRITVVLTDGQTKATTTGTCTLRILSGTAPLVTGAVIVRILPGGPQLADGSVLRVGDTVQLGIQPVPGKQQSLSWLVIDCGKGLADVTTAQNGPTVSLQGKKPGLFYLKVEVTDGQTQTTIASTCTLRILPDLATLTVGTTIGDDGTMGISEAVAGQPDEFFHTIYLVTHNNTGATYGNTLNNRRMQASVAQLLNKLLAALAARGTPGQLEVVQAYTPGASHASAIVNQLLQVGRAIILHHPTLKGDMLAMLAHSVGFTYVCRQAGEQVLALQRPGELITITGPQEVNEEGSITLRLSPQATPSAVAASAKTLYTANSGSDTVSIVDLTMGQVKDAVKVGWGPTDLVLSPDGKRLYSADSQGNTITVMDVDTATGNLKIVQILPVQPNPVALAHHPTAQRLYVVCQNDNSLLEVDTNALNVVTRLAVGTSPTGVALTPDGKQVWIVLNGAKQIAIVGTTSPIAQTGSIALTQTPLELAIAPDGNQAYVTQPDDNSVVVLDVPGQKIIKTTPVTSSSGGIAVSTDSSTIYVTSKEKNSVYRLQPNGTMQGSISTGQTADDIFVQNNGTRIYIVSTQNNVLGEINTQQNRAINRWNLGAGLGEYQSWTLDPDLRTQASLSNSTQAAVTLKGTKAGPALLKVVYALPGKTPPYTFTVRLNEALLSDKTQAPIIRKEQYDLLMNILNAFHPLGVEVTTDAIRKYVIEMRGLRANIIPDYTYPTFRLRGPLAH